MCITCMALICFLWAKSFLILSLHMYLTSKDNDDNCSTTSFPDEILLPTLKDMVMRYQVPFLYRQPPVWFSSFFWLCTLSLKWSGRMGQATLHALTTLWSIGKHLIFWVGYTTRAPLDKRLLPIVGESEFHIQSIVNVVVQIKLDNLLQKCLCMPRVLQNFEW